MAQAQIYIREIQNFMTTIRTLYEHLYELDGQVHRFGGVLRRAEDHAPPNFRLEYQPEADNGGILLYSM